MGIKVVDSVDRKQDLSNLVLYMIVACVATELSQRGKGLKMNEKEPSQNIMASHNNHNNNMASHNNVMGGHNNVGNWSI